jgi:hypothetical protein
MSSQLVEQFENPGAPPSKAYPLQVIGLPGIELVVEKESDNMPML